MLNLISRFYDVQQGRVLVDGADIRDLRIFQPGSLLGFFGKR